MTSKLGIFSIIAGVVLGLFAFLAKFMQTATFLVDMTLSTFIQAPADKIMDLVSNDFIYNCLYAFFYEWHLAVVLIGFGVILLIVGTIMGKN